ncbi:hypothetical protein D3C80_707250 [compost metagenome]
MAQLGQHDAHHIQRVVHADADPKGDHRQGRHLHANTQRHHQRFAEDRGEYQWQHRAEHRAPGAEGHQAEHDHRAVDPPEHVAVGLLDHLVGGSLDACTAGSHEEAGLLAVVGLGKRLDAVDHPRQGVGLVIVQVGIERQQAAVVVVQPARGTGGDHVQGRLVVDQVIPLRAAFGEADQHPAVEQRQRVCRVHALQATQLPVEVIHVFQGAVGRTATGGGAHHHREHIAAGAVVPGDEGIVAVVARIGAQLGSAGVEVANLQVQAHGVAPGSHQRSDGDARRRPAPAGEQVEEAPHRMLARSAGLGLFSAQAAPRRTGTDAHVGEQHRQQNQVGEDQHRHAQAGDDGQVLDHLYLNDHEHGKTDRIA